jgi:ADP-heptose:LPS heptosyltransferase
LKILIIRFSSIGDIVLTTPVVRCMKKQLPSGTEIHYLTKPAFKTLLDQNPYIDKVWLLENDENETIRNIKKQGFDRIVDLHNNLRTIKIKWKVGVRATSFNKLNLRKFILTQLKLDLMPDIHIVDRYFEAVKDIGVKNDGEGLDYFNPSSAIELNEFLPMDLKFVSMAIGGQHFTKRLPLHKLEEIIEGINSKVVLLGGKDDVQVALLLQQNYPEKVLNLVGKLSLHQSAGVVKQSKLLITHDTGMMHIATALKKEVVVIWGNTVPKLGMYPYYGSHNIKYYNFEVDNLSCRPCSKLGYKSCPKGHFKCMELQDTTQIIKAAESLQA